MISAGVDCALAPQELQNASQTRISCTCVAGSTGATPRHTNPYVFDAIDGVIHPSAVIYTAATWCGWPCSVGVDAGGQIPPDSGPVVDAGLGTDAGASIECVNDIMAAPDDSYNVEYESPVSMGTLAGGVLELGVPWILSSTTVQGRAVSAGRVRARMELSMESGGLYVKRYGETDDPPMSHYLRARFTLTDRDGAASETGPVMNLTLDCPASQRDTMQTWEYEVLPTGGGRAIRVIRPEGSSVLVNEIYSGR